MARLTVVVSQAQGRNPEKRKLEEEIITRLMLTRGIDVLVTPHFYDLNSESTAMLALQQIPGHAVVLSWMFPRAAHWLMDRNGVRGKLGTVLLGNDEDDEQEELEEAKASVEQPARVIDHRPVPDRYLYHIDLRSEKATDPFVEEVLRIQRESAVSVVSLGLGSLGTGEKTSAAKAPAAKGMIGLGASGVVSDVADFSVDVEDERISPEARERFSNPTADTALPLGPINDLLNGQPASEGLADGNGEATVERMTESAAKRRWYPVIDYSRCTNCMECIDFCLFGVYGVDTLDTILVDQPDNCRKGCPACSRVCPENAIMFPQHKTPAIAGSAEDSGGFKIDLSKLFGAPDEGKSAEEIAARERDEQLMLTGRQPLGMSGVKRRSKEATERDELDALMDQLDELDV